jgi:TonB family protein
MITRSLFVCAIGAIGVFVATTQSMFAQEAEPAVAPQTGVVLVKLAPPIYPPLARQARIMGDVKIQLTVRQDGSVETAELFSGHPMLKQAALDSAKKSQFECRGCNDRGTSYSLTYTFGFQNDGGCSDVVEEQRVRSLKCLYLWKCGVRSISTWHRPENRAPEVTQSDGHVTILVSSACVEA